MSPQFHVKFDTSFHTVRQQTMPKSTWLHAMKFTKEKDKQTNLDQPKTASPQTKLRKHVHFSEGEQMGPPMPPSEGAKPAPQGPKTGPKHAKFPTSVHNQRGQGAMPPRDMNQKQGCTSQPAAREEVAATPGKLDSPNGLRRSRREKQPLKRLIEVMYTEIERNADTKGEIFAYETMYLSPRGSGLACQQRPLLTYKASTDPNTMYMHEAMREPDKVEFLKAMEKEVEDQMKNGNYSIINKNDIPKSSTILPAVWQMKRKSDIKTRDVKKYKARLNIDGSKMRPGVHYDLTYTPVASWTSVRLLMALTTLNGWHTKQIDHVLAFPQAPVEKELFMRIPRGFEVEGVDDPKNYVLKDADFTGNWDKNEAGNDPDTARSRNGYIIMYAGCPIIWKSHLQTEIALSSTESEYTGLSYALREAIPIMDLLNEMLERGFKVSGTKAKMHCKVFEDNSGALEIAKNPKYCP